MRTTGFLYAIGAAITWGLVYTIDQRILKGLSPIMLIFIDAVLTSIILLPVLWIQRTEFASLGSVSSKVWLYVLIGLVLATLANFFIYSSIKTLGASTASIFEIAYPFFVVLFSYFLLGAEINLYFLIGALFMFVGSAIIITLA